MARFAAQRRVRHTSGIVGVALFGGCLLEGTPGFTGSDATSEPDTTGTDVTGDTSVGSSIGDTTGDTGDPPMPSAPRGVLPRETCGLDLDDDGVPGTGEDCNVCSWAPASPPDDPDGDGIVERVLWVDCGEGVDDGDCRDRDAPCGTLDHALDLLPLSADADNFESIVCFTGVCESATPLPLANGLPGATSVETTGFAYPADPVLLVGADRDGDGVHPPQDADDVATIRATDPSESARVFYYAAPDQRARDIELAHFTVEYDGPGFPLLTTPYTGRVERLYIHDVVVDSPRHGLPNAAERSIFDLARDGQEGYTGTTLADVALENLRITGFGGTLMRLDTIGGIDHGAIRIANVEATASGCDAPTCPDLYDETMVQPEGATVGILGLYGPFTGVAVVDSIFDAQTDEWTPYGGDGGRSPPPTAIVVGECTQDIVIRNNELRGFATALRVEATSADHCLDGGVGEVRFEGNLVVGNDGESRLRTATTIPIDVRSRGLDGTAARGTFARLDLLNNAILPGAPAAGCVLLDAGQGQSAGPVVIQHETCVVELDPTVTESGAITIRGGSSIASLDLRNDVVLAHEGTALLHVDAPSGAWRIDGNAFGGSPTFTVAGEAETLDDWRARGFDGGSLACTPEFDVSDGYHLAATDACAIDGGVADVGVAADIDGQTRAGAPDIGADERVE